MITPKKRIRVIPGDVVAIPLSDGRYAFGRYLHYCGIAIYDYLSKYIVQVDDLRKANIRFFAGIFTQAINRGDWPRIGHLPSNTPHEDYLPPQYIDDSLRPGYYDIIYRGEIRKAEQHEVKGLDRQRMWFPDPFLEEIERRFKQQRKKLPKQAPPPGWVKRKQT